MLLDPFIYFIVGIYYSDRKRQRTPLPIVTLLHLIFLWSVCTFICFPNIMVCDCFRFYTIVNSSFSDRFPMELALFFQQTGKTRAFFLCFSLLLKRIYQKYKTRFTALIANVVHHVFILYIFGFLKALESYQKEY